MHAGLTEVRRFYERLKGILMGISIDNQINDQEVYALNDWLDMHSNLIQYEPFSSVAGLVRKILEDNYIDEEERGELLELCWSYDDDTILSAFSIETIGILHGIFQGILADGKIRYNEIIGLKNWIEVHSNLKNYWPVCEVWPMVRRVLADGRIDEQEEEELFTYFRNFLEIPVKKPVIHDDIYKRQFMRNSSPVLKPIDAICARNPDIVFPNRTFCFTGPARTGKRKVLHEIVERLEGIPKTGISESLDYLVIGAQSSPAWAFSTYGRKIEAVMNNVEAVEKVK